MEDYNKTSNKIKQPQSVTEKKVAKKVVKGTVKTKKKSETKKLAEVFIAEDVRNVKNFIVREILIPSMKELFFDIVNNSLSMSLWGDASHGRGAHPSKKIGYNQISSISSSNKTRFEERDRFATYNYDEIEFQYKPDAEAVLDALFEILEEYGHVKVSDLYDTVGVTGSHSDYNYGWYNLRGSDIARTRSGGWTIRLPKATALR